MRVIIFSIFISVSLSHSAQSVTTVTIDRNPEFPGGQKALADYIRSNIKIPAEVSERNISGETLLKFLVNKQGMVTRVMVEKNLAGCAPCDSEAVNVIRNMPRWEPAIRNGKPISAYLRLPIKFNNTEAEVRQKK